MNLTKEEMLEAINDVRNRKINFKFFEIDEDVLYSNYENDNFKIIKVQETGGDEGDGEYMDVVFQIIRKSDMIDGYIKFEGYHNSWSECYYHTIKVVQPREVTVTIYEDIK